MAVTLTWMFFWSRIAVICAAIAEYGGLEVSRGLDSAGSLTRSKSRGGSWGVHGWVVPPHWVLPCRQQRSRGHEMQTGEGGDGG